MRNLRTVAAGVAAIVFVAMSRPASAALPDPVFDGVVVQDVTQPYAFDRVGTDADGSPYITNDFYRGIVRTRVIRDIDGSFDFLLHLTGAQIGSFEYAWSSPVSLVVSAFALELADASGEVSAGIGPAVGRRVVSSDVAVTARDSDGGAGLLGEALFLLDTDARAYSLTGSYTLSDAFDRVRGQGGGSSGPIVTFAPAVPEAETAALMLVGLGLMTLAGRRRRAVAQAPNSASSERAKRFRSSGLVQ